MEGKGNWVSVSDYAHAIGRSTSHVYMLISEKKVEYMQFKRGKSNGYLIYSTKK